MQTVIKLKVIRTNMVNWQRILAFFTGLQLRVFKLLPLEIHVLLSFYKMFKGEIQANK